MDNNFTTSGSFVARDIAARDKFDKYNYLT